MKEGFYVKLKALVAELDVKRQSKYLITTETYNKILDVLSSETKYDHQFNFWAKKHFTIVKIGDKPAVHSIKKKLPVVTYEDLFDTINECHAAVGHLGRDKTWHEVN